MLVLGQSAFLEALGWSLLNSFWQFGALWIVYLVLIHALKNITASAKHAAALLFMSLGVACFFINVWLTCIAFSNNSSYNGLSYSIVVNTLHLHLLYNFIKDGLDAVLPYISAIYLIIIVLLFGRLSRYIYTSKQLQTKGLHKMAADWRIYVDELAQRMSITQKVKVWLSEKIDTPLIIGFFKPVILLPVALVNQLSSDQIESILLHELAHIKRNDYAVNLMIAITGIIFFFNPFAKLFINAIRKEREYCCDDWVLQFNYDPHQYASALLTLEKNRSGLVSLGIGANGSTKNVLLQRVHRIMQLPYPSKDQRLKLSASIFLVLLMMMIAVIKPIKNIAVQTIPQMALNNFLKDSPGIKFVSNTINTIGQDKKAATDQNNAPVKKAKLLTTSLLAIEPASMEDNSNLMDVAERLSTLNAEEENKITASAINVNPDERDFSLPEKTVVAPMPDPIENNYPYVPGSSFSYHFTEDTATPKYKTYSYNELLAKQDLVKAQVALKKINWKKIEKELGNNKAAFEKIKLEIANEISLLNWQQINQETKDLLEEQQSQLSEQVLDQSKQTERQYLRQQANYQKNVQEKKTVECKGKKVVVI